MQVNLDIDQIVQHLLPWEFTVTAGGKTWATRRPSIGELGAMQNISGKKIADLELLLDSFFVEPPGIRWDLEKVKAFFEGYLTYFNLHAQKKISRRATVWRERASRASGTRASRLSLSPRRAAGRLGPRLGGGAGDASGLSFDFQALLEIEWVNYGVLDSMR
jgi:hypothetical protein